MTTAPDRVNLWHGYGLADIDQLARIAVATDRWDTTDAAERYNAFRAAIVEHLITSETAPTRRDLVHVGHRAADRYVEAEMRYHGYDPRRLDRGQGALPNFQRHWQTAGHTPWDERLIEHLALTQVWPRLTLAQQQTVIALATTGDHQEAADLLGLQLPAFSGRLKKARRTIARLWHEHETPRRQRMDKRVLARSGTYRGKRLLTEEDLERLRDRRVQGATYRELATETGYSQGALCNLLRGKCRPARAA
jgi:predicted DNA-binding protein (UPF0251 family)